MRIVPRRDGTTVLQGENGDIDEVLTTAVLETCMPAGARRCDCGYEYLDLRQGGEGPELYCRNCHRVFRRFALHVAAARLA